MSDLDQNDPDVLAPVEGENDPSTSAGPRRRKPRKKEPVAAPAPVAAVEAEAPAAPPVAAKPAAAKPAAPVKVIEPVVDAAPADADLAPSELEEAVEDGDDEPVLAAPPPVRPTSRRDDYRSGRLFSDFPISPELIQGLTDLGYSEATQVQAEAIEPALAGQDLLVRAKTGTGKTAAFGIPLVERCEPGLRKVQVLVLSPTRELANQIATEIAGIAKYRDLRILPIYGGVGMGGQEKARVKVWRSSSAPPAACSTTSAGATSTSATSAASAWTRPTRCCRWASTRRSRRSSSTPRLRPRC